MCPATNVEREDQEMNVEETKVKKEEQAKRLQAYEEGMKKLMKNQKQKEEQ